MSVTPEYVLPSLLADELVDFQTVIRSCRRRVLKYTKLLAMCDDILKRLDVLIPHCVSDFVTSRGHGELNPSSLPQLKEELQRLVPIKSRFDSLQESIQQAHECGDYTRKYELRDLRNKLFSQVNRYESLQSKVRLIEQYNELIESINPSRRKWLYILANNLPFPAKK